MENTCPNINVHGGNGGDQTCPTYQQTKDSGDDGLGTDMGIGGNGGCDASL